MSTHVTEARTMTIHCHVERSSTPSSIITAVCVEMLHCVQHDMATSRLCVEMLHCVQHDKADRQGVACHLVTLSPCHLVTLSSHHPRHAPRRARRSSRARWAAPGAWRWAGALASAT